jgi:hypothetical protein
MCTSLSCGGRARLLYRVRARARARVRSRVRVDALLRRQQYEICRRPPGATLAKAKTRPEEKATPKGEEEASYTSKPRLHMFALV